MGARDGGRQVDFNKALEVRSRTSRRPHDLSQAPRQSPHQSPQLTVTDRQDPASGRNAPWQRLAKRADGTSPRPKNSVDDDKRKYHQSNRF